MSKIQWTDETWNPTTGCTKISPGCAHCYIETTPPFRMEGRKFVKGHIPLRLHADRLDKPLHWRKPRRVFVNSLSDLFHDDVPDEFIDRVFAVMALSYWHTFQVLTKRPKRMAAYFANEQCRISAIHNAMGSTPDGYRRTEKFPPVHPTFFDFVDRVRGYDKKWPWSRGLCGYFANPPWPLYNVWLGVSAEDQQRLDDRLPWLLKTPAAVRFLSCEPLLGPLVLPSLGFTGPQTEVDWVIVGGESGRGSRACDLRWIRYLVEQCKATGVPCFVKQFGSNAVNEKVGGFVAKYDTPLHHKGGDPNDWPEDLRVRQFPAERTVPA